MAWGTVEICLSHFFCLLITVLIHYLLRTSSSVILVFMISFAKNADIFELLVWLKSEKSLIIDNILMIVH